MAFDPPGPPEGRFGKWAYQLWDYVIKNRIDALTGSGVVSGSGIVIGTGTSGTYTLGLRTTGVVPGTYGSTNVIPRFAVGGDGRLTLSTNIGTLGTFASFASLVGAGDLLGTTTTNTFTGALSTTGVTAGTYTSANITVDAKGRILVASNNPWHINQFSVATGGTLSIATGNEIVFNASFLADGQVVSHGRFTIL